MGCADKSSRGEDPGCEVRSPLCVPGTRMETEQTRGQNETGSNQWGKDFSPQRPKQCFSTQMQMKDQRALFLKVWFGRVINKRYRPERTLSVSK